MKVQRGLSPASVNQALAGMDNFFRFLGLGAAIVRREELPRSAPRALDDEQRRLLLQAAEESTPRDRAIVALLLFTGLRLSETAALQVADVRISARKGVVVVRSGKGDAYREVELNALVRAMLDEWVAERRKIAPEGEMSFFVSRTGSALSSRSIDLAVRRVAGRAGLQLSAHVLRHTFVTGLCGQATTSCWSPSSPATGGWRPRGATACPLARIAARRWQTSRSSSDARRDPHRQSARGVGALS
jgi:site-specific recombinase XerD